MVPSESFRFGNQPIGPVTEAEQHSAGGVVYRREGHRLKICLVSKKNGRIWALPKGRLNEGETTQETAFREILEETGHETSVGPMIDEIHYYFFLNENQTYYHKTVTFYVMKLVRENARERDQEADEVSWFEFPEALRKLSYLNEKKILKKAQRMI